MYASSNNFEEISKNFRPSTDDGKYIRKLLYLSTNLSRLWNEQISFNCSWRTYFIPPILTRVAIGPEFESFSPAQYFLLFFFIHFFLTLRSSIFYCAKGLCTMLCCKPTNASFWNYYDIFLMKTRNRKLSEIIKRGSMNFEKIVELFWT